jgi:hypothetical protein
MADFFAVLQTGQENAFVSCFSREPRAPKEQYSFRGPAQKKTPPSLSGK